MKYIVLTKGFIPTAVPCQIQDEDKKFLGESYYASKELAFERGSEMAKDFDLILIWTSYFDSIAGKKCDVDLWVHNNGDIPNPWKEIL